MPEIVKYNDYMEDHGADHRIERRALPEVDGPDAGQFYWVVYKLTPTGAAEGKPGLHPMLKDENGNPIQTTEIAVWVPEFVGPENAARMRLDSLVG
jgi:hypothetical protein